MSEYVGCNGKNVNENKFAAKKKLTKHKTNFSGAREKGDMLVYPLWMMAQQQQQKEVGEGGSRRRSEGSCRCTFYPTCARTHNQHGRSCPAAAAAPHGIVEVVSGAAGWRPFGQALAEPMPPPLHAFRQQNKNEQDEFTRYKKNLYLCMYECVRVWVCVSVRGASAKNGNAKFLAENSQSPEHARYESAEEGAAACKVEGCLLQRVMRE